MMGMCKYSIDLRNASFPYSNVCITNITEVVHGLSLLVAVSFTCIIMYKTNASFCTSVQFPMRHARMVTSILLMLCRMMMFTEGIMRYVASPRNILATLQLLTPDLINLILILLTVCLHQLAELRNKPTSLIVLFFIWPVAICIDIARIANIMTNASHPEIFVINYLLFSDFILYSTMLIIEISTLFQLKYFCFSHPKILSPLAELKRTKHVYDYVNILSKITFSWMTEILVAGYKEPLELTDLGRLPKSETSSFNYHLLKSKLNSIKVIDQGLRSLSLMKGIWLTFYPMIIWSGVYRILSDVLSFLPPLCIGYILTFIENSEDDMPQASSSNITVHQFFSNGYILGIGMGLIILIQNSCLQTHHYLITRQGMRLKEAMQSLVYEKVLKISSWALSSGQTSSGEIISHMASDSMNIMIFCFVIHNIWAYPFKILVTLMLLYRQIGFSAIIGGSIVILLIPVQYYLTKTLALMQKNAMEFSDKRLSQCNELFRNIKFLKLYAWEILFAKEVSKARKSQLKQMLKASALSAVLKFITTGTPILVTITAFSVFSQLETKPLTPSVAFSSLALFDLLTLPMLLLPANINNAVKAKLSLERLSRFLQTTEAKHSNWNTDTQKDTYDDNHDDDDDNTHNFSHEDDETYTPQLGNNQFVEAIEFDELNETAQPLLNRLELKFDVDEVDNAGDHVENQHFVDVIDGAFSFEPQALAPDMADINVSFQGGQFTIIVGPVGSGKTSLLLSILGEISQNSGQITLKQSVKLAYVSQSPWIMNATLKDNILFGSKFDYNTYQEILRACALDLDLKELPAGDDTEIGEKGINLSGGQKQRVELARAMYSGADVILLDDPFSALDACVSDHILTHAIQDFLLQRGCAVVMITHQIALLEHADQVIVMNDKKIVHQGSLDALKRESPSWYMTYSEAKEKRLKSKEDNINQYDIDTVDAISDEHMSKLISTTTQSDGLILKKEDKEDKQDKGKLIIPEERLLGTVSWRVYWSYIKACTVSLFMFLTFLRVARTFVTAATDLWLSKWSQSMSGLNTTLENESEINEYVQWYLILGGTALLMSLIVAVLTEIIGLKAGATLHSAMLKNTIQVPIRFFETSPLGRIMTRFSTDIQTIDERLPVSIEGLFRSVLLCLATLVVNTVSSFYFLIWALPAVVVYIILQNFFRKSSRELQRLDNLTKSPVMALFSETLSGLSNIRAYRQQKRFMGMMFKRIDNNNLAYLWLNTGNRWLGIRLDYLGALIITGACISSTIGAVQGYITPSFAGLAIAYSLMMCNNINWVVRWVTETENQMNSVERVCHFINMPKQTDIFQQGQGPIGENWLKKGHIEFNDVSLGYEESKAVVKDININIEPGQKIGICGRTGSGKSSLTLALFRMIDIHNGSITIDGTSITQIPLHVLRSQMTIIPQEPTLFQSSIRFNLDPYNEKSDDEIWNVLAAVELKVVISDRGINLDSQLLGGGEDFSAGQKQLFCLARALLRKSKVLVLDEATASTDINTDQTIQNIIQTYFQCSTVITIAHRLSSILKSDLILVMDNGKISEMGEPSKLASDGNSIFHSLLKASDLL